MWYGEVFGQTPYHIPHTSHLLIKNTWSDKIFILKIADMKKAGSILLLFSLLFTFSCETDLEIAEYKEISAGWYDTGRVLYA